jgi:ankyrin repeat protein
MRLDGGCACAGSSPMSIWSAAVAGDLAEVQWLVGQDPGMLDAKDGICGMTPLVVASQGGQLGVVRWLVERGAAMHERSIKGFSVLYLAIAQNRGPVVRLLLETGVDPTIATTSEALTPLMGASFRGHFEVTRLVLGRPNVITTTNQQCAAGRTALWCACTKGPGGRSLLERGADPSIVSNRGSTPLMAACVQGHLEVVRLLLNHPSSAVTVNSRRACGKTALYWACFRGHSGVARALLESGADPTIPSNKGNTPTAIAKKRSEREDVSPEGRRECVAALEVRFFPVPPSSLSTGSSDQLVEAVRCCRGMVAGGGAGLPPVEGPAGGRPAGERRGGGAEGAGGGGGEGAGGLGGARGEGGPVSGADGAHGIRGRVCVCVVVGGGLQ